MTTHEDQVATTEDVRLTRLAGQCGAGTCPTIYRTDRATIVVQGYVVKDDSAGVKVPDGERLVEIPVEVLLAAADKIREQG
ncbi:hypothetical protein [Actinoplanes solisilvae]|uniref:hypothetical protein n=1 Tax=Actinoplanes solisilvae TaxID=2486853 RepID=UPI000FD8B2D2|nr:hypothetical protein [Actinoplanes solisilvae]